MATKKAPAKKAAPKKTAAKKPAAKPNLTIVPPKPATFPGKWTAVLDLMPPLPGRLTVTGTLVMPSPGYKLKLVEAVPQGINPAILLLVLKITPPIGPHIWLPTKETVVFKKKTNTKYKTVTILPFGINVPVQIVH